MTTGDSNTTALGRDPDEGAVGRPVDEPASIHDFLTDGKLARLCEAIARLVETDVSLLDDQGHRIVPVGETSWETEPEPASLDQGALRFPLEAGGRAIGWVVLSCAPDDPRIEEVVRLIAGASSELCGDVLELRDRVKELSVLYRLSSLLSAADSVDSLISISLKSAIEVLDLDAGSIVLLPDGDDRIDRETEDELRLKASEGLSEDWLSDPLPLSIDRVFDRASLAGETPTSEDLTQDDRVLVRERCAEEGIRGFIGAGLIFRNRPVGLIRVYSRAPRRFSQFEMRLLKSIGQQCAAAVEHARLSLARDREARLTRQLEMAADIQRRMLPSTKPELPGVDLAARYLPSDGVGGDFYDWFELGSSLGLVIGDVVGKGIGAGLLMASVRATLRAHVQDVFELGEVLQRVNQALCRDTLESEFATVWYAVYEPETRRLNYCSAGHDPTFVVRVPEHREPTRADIDELTASGLVLGLDPSQRYQLSFYDMHPGDVLVAYSDGLPDARDFDENRFTRERLHRAVLTALRNDPAASAEAIVQHVLWELRRFAGLSLRHDDQTVMIMRVGETAQGRP